MARLVGKKSIVTGAASGFGREIARRFAREGAEVAIVDLNGDGARGRRGDRQRGHCSHLRRLERTGCRGRGEGSH